MQKYNTIINFWRRLHNKLRIDPLFVKTALFIINYKKE